MTWILVALGGAAGTALGLLFTRRPLAATAVVCASMGAFHTQSHSTALTALVGVGVLGSAASMVAVSLARPIWLGGDAVLRTAWRVVRGLAVHCTVGATFALFGYLALRAGITLERKLS
ncbi:hypothetical protein [Mycobacterium sp. NAZ190054]|uniref:hypothetical protein n=1 Tax=Mycobacterium sp. NAZ190054 TaxID=1747766 RepID=UPI000799F122|nr:hypothetical protein [Mycobacterium sp. NAZ190054]KWX60304.1 hypothetical protein ASJ79_01335 [Mycobacterium sp. NAZ190054]